MVDPTNIFGFSRQLAFTCVRAESTTTPTCCSKGCLNNRLVSLYMLSYSCLVIVGTFFELMYRICQLVKSCWREEADKQLAKTNMIDISIGVFTATILAPVLIIKFALSTLFHPACGNKKNSL